MISSVWEAINQYAKNLTAENMQKTLPVSVWVGFADLGSPRGAELMELLWSAGVKKLVFCPTNSASTADWKWQPRRTQIQRGIVAAHNLGFECWVGPWIRCNRAFMKQCGEQLRRLDDDVGGVIRGVELDAEGSFEWTAKKAGRRHKQGVSGAVQDAIKELEPYVDGWTVGATVLYFNRPAGDALIRLPIVTELAVQAYSVFFNGKSAKARATHAKNYQPGILQDRAVANYAEFKKEHNIKKLIVGLGWWSQDRSRAPTPLRISEKEAFRRASDACLDLDDVDGVCGWACHLWDSRSSKKESKYLQLVLDEIRYLTGSEKQKTRVFLTDETLETPDGDIDICWSRMFFAPEVAQGGRPFGWSRVREEPTLDKNMFTIAAKHIRSKVHGKFQRGTCVPFDMGGFHMLGVYQKHTATYRNGRRVDGLDLSGLTVFVQRRVDGAA